MNARHARLCTYVWRPCVCQPLANHLPPSPQPCTHRLLGPLPCPTRPRLPPSLSAAQGGLKSFGAILVVPAFCDDASASVLVNALPIVITDKVYNQCPIHATPLASRACPYGKALVTLDVDADGAGAKDPEYPTVLQCVDPANFDMFSGEMAISYCWSLGQLPDPFARNAFVIEMADVDYFNIDRMPGGAGWKAV